MNKMRTTTFTKRVIDAHMLRRSNVGASCSRNTAIMFKVATIRLLLSFQVTPIQRAPARVYAEIATRTGVPVPRPARPTVLLVERKNHVNRRVDFHRLAIEQRRLIAPLTHGIQSGLLQQRMAVHDFKLRNGAVLTDDGVQTHGAGDAGLARQRRINRLDTVDDSRCLNVAADAERTGLLGFRRGRRSAHASDNATKYTTHGATGNAARDATLHAGIHVRFGGFLNDFDVMRNGLWL